MAWKEKDIPSGPRPGLQPMTRSNDHADVYNKMRYGTMHMHIMRLSIDNKVAVDLTNNWSVGGRQTCHVDVRYYFFRELKEENVIISEFTKNLARNLFENHTAKFCGNDKYMKSHEDRDSQGEGVGGYKDSV